MLVSETGAQLCKQSVDVTVVRLAMHGMMACSSWTLSGPETIVTAQCPSGVVCAPSETLVAHGSEFIRIIMR